MQRIESTATMLSCSLSLSRSRSVSLSLSHTHTLSRSLPRSLALSQYREVCEKLKDRGREVVGEAFHVFQHLGARRYYLH